MNNGNFSTYINSLKERRPEIAEFLLRCERNHLTVEDMTAMRHSMRHLVELTRNQNGQLHKLAIAMQCAIHDELPMPADELHALGKTLLAACHDALVMTTTTLPSQSFAPAQSITRSGRKPVVLSVDDDRIIHHMIEGMFGEHVNILTAPDGAAGLAMIREHKPDLVLLDDAMPHMTGMKLIETLKNDNEFATLPVIMLTSSDRPQDIERANAAGAVDYVIKPFNPKRLAETVYKTLSSVI